MVNDYVFGGPKMKRLAILTASAAFITAPAFAAKITIEFAPEGKDTFEVVLDDVAGTVTSPEGTAPMSFDWDTNTLCAEMEPKACATFEGEAKPPEVGAASAYTSNDGGSGIATILAVE